MARHSKKADDVEVKETKPLDLNSLNSDYKEVRELMEKEGAKQEG